MKNIKNLLLALSLVATCSWANVVELVVPWSAGGTTDKVAQVVLTHAKPEFAKYGMTLNIAYKPGAAGMLGANAVASTAPGNMQILLAGNTMISTPMVNPGVATYDVAKDFVLLGYIGHVPMVTVVNTNSGIRNIVDFKKACRDRKLNYGTAGVGSNTHISSALVNSMFGCNAAAIPYKGAAPAVTDLLGGHIDYLSDYEAGVLPHVVSGKFNALVILDRRRSAELPGVPSIVELGHPEYNFYNWFALTGNATADAGQLIIAQRIFDRILADADVKEQLAKAGIRGHRQVAQDFLATERKNFLQILRNANITKQ
jgi:tripartite-type tricarboxylate transporter receptor subunit TctC